MNSPDARNWSCLLFSLQIWLQQMEGRDETDADTVEIVQRRESRWTSLLARTSHDWQEDFFSVEWGNGILYAYKRYVHFN